MFSFMFFAVKVKIQEALSVWLADLWLFKEFPGRRRRRRRWRKNHDDASVIEKKKISQSINFFLYWVFSFRSIYELSIHRYRSLILTFPGREKYFWIFRESSSYISKWPVGSSWTESAWKQGKNKKYLHKNQELIQFCRYIKACWWWWSQLK